MNCQPEPVEGGFSSLLSRCNFINPDTSSIKATMKQHNYFVYIIQCSDSSYYTGVTNDLERRLSEHNEGFSPDSYTASRRPVVLKYYERFQYIDHAIEWEKQIKGWSRKKKEALFQEDWKEISRLSKAYSRR